MSGQGNPDGIHWNFEAHQAVAELMLKALAEAGVKLDEDPRLAMAVVVVTDSSSRLQPDEFKQLGYCGRCRCTFIVDGADLRDGVDDVPYDVHDRAVYHRRRRARGAAEAYRQALADSGGDGVVAVHLSAALSSTYSSAVARRPRVRLRRCGWSIRARLAMGVGFVALAAARAAAGGGPTRCR